MSDLGVQKQPCTRDLEIDSHNGTNIDDESTTREPTNVVQSWKKYVYLANCDFVEEYYGTARFLISGIR